MKLPGFLGLLMSGAIIFSGCIHHESTIHHDVSRVTVEFESETAGRVFYEAMSHMHSNGESTTQIEIPVVFEHKRHVVSGEGERFNRAVAECDTNKDGRISDLEARIFASRHH